MTRWYLLALELTRRSSYPVPQKRMAAIIVRGGALVSRATNIAGLVWPGKHAEVRAIRPHMCYDGAVLYVARANGLASRPCHACWNAARQVGISRVVYAGTDGSVRSEKILDT